MKKLKTLFSLLFLICLLSALSCNTEVHYIPSPLEEAEHYMKKYVSEDFNFVDSLGFENIKCVYDNDSLIILHADFTAKYRDKGIGHYKIEYFLISQNSAKYETYGFADDGCKYMDSLTWSKKKSGTLYENLGYDESIRYLASLQTNANGRHLGDTIHYKSIYIDEPIETGSWQITNFQDSNDKYIFLKGQGSNYYADSSKDGLYVTLGVSKDYFFFNIFDEESGKLVTDNKWFYYANISDTKGKSINFVLGNINGDITPVFDVEKDYQDFLKLIKNAEFLFIDINDRHYVMKLKVKGFNKAIQLINQ